MKEQLVSFKTAKLAKEKGFNELETHIGTAYSQLGDLCVNTGATNQFEAPTQSLLQKWLREKHNINVEVISTYEQGRNNQYICYEGRWNNYNDIIETSDGIRFPEHEHFDGHHSYESAIEETLHGALKLLP